MGNGTVTYSNFDPRGHALRRYDGLNRLRYEVDRAERVSKVRECDASWQDVRILRQFDYATANNGSDKANGKLYQATANTLISTTTFPVVETYTYAGVGGRVSRRRTGVDGRTIDLDLTWNDLGRPASVTYPNDSGLGDPSRTVSNAYSWGMLTGVTSYTTSISYHPNLMVNAVAHANGATVTYAKDDNDMRRPKSVATTGTASNWSSGNYAFDGAGNVKAIGSDWYTYDDVSRLTVGTTTAGTKRQCATYNAFGTITALGIGTSSCSPSEISVDAGTNRMSESLDPPLLTYNAAGSMTAWTDYSYTWDPLGQMASVYGGSMTKRTFLYTADGERIEERIGSNPLSPTSRIIAVRGLDSKVLRLFTDSGGGLAWTKDYVYREGLPLASVDGGGTKHFHLDHLGTIRRITGTGTPAAVVGSHDYYPFGLEATDPTQDVERLKFTGHERDQQGTPASQVDDLDYMHARYYNFNIARFLSVDPGRDADAHAPQSWNLFGYVHGSPLGLTDPSGKFAQTTCTGSKTEQTCTVTASIVLYPANGEKISAEAMKQYAAQVEQSIEGAWSGSYVADGVSVTVKADVAVSVAGGEFTAANSGAENVIGVSSVAANRMDSRRPGSSQDFGTLNTNDIGRGVAGHEFGHLMGLGDRGAPSQSYMRTDYLITPGLPQHPTANDLKAAFAGVPKPGIGTLRAPWAHFRPFTR